MDDFTLARTIHVLAVLLWTGGVAFVTLVVMPMLKASAAPDSRLAQFHKIESGFAWQARIWVVIAGVSGFWMIWRGDMWSRFIHASYWWMHAMLAVWAIFALMLFVIEPLHLHRSMSESASPAQDFAKLVRMHQLLLALSLITVFGAVGGSHGLF
ncbi:hypothetical protein [Parasphingorhabdus sp.]|uniref:hypothetical protein n=1 Tax=Parasphingorhabdus sp. TaxID=2709688 RepID=UPI003A95C284